MNQRIHKSWLDHEHQQRWTNDNHRETNKRIVSLGSDLWAENEGLRKQEEKEGRIPRLGQDSKGACLHLHTFSAIQGFSRVSKEVQQSANYHEKGINNECQQSDLNTRRTVAHHDSLFEKLGAEW